MKYMFAIFFIGDNEIFFEYQEETGCVLKKIAGAEGEAHVSLGTIAQLQGQASGRCDTACKLLLCVQPFKVLATNWDISLHSARH